MASQPAQVMLPNVVEKQANVDSYIEAFRSYGHISANNPLEASTIDKRLMLDFHGLSEQDLSSDFLTRGVTPNNVASLEEIKRALELHYLVLRVLKLHMLKTKRREMVARVH